MFIFQPDILIRPNFCFNISIQSIEQANNVYEIGNTNQNGGNGGVGDMMVSWVFNGKITLPKHLRTFTCVPSLIPLLCSYIHISLANAWFDLVPDQIQ